MDQSGTTHGGSCPCCGHDLRGSDHCHYCGCEQYETRCDGTPYLLGYEGEFCSTDCPTGQRFQPSREGFLRYLGYGEGSR